LTETPLRLCRIIPIPHARNPNLADILKVYKRWEGRGIGMASLVNYALDNKIDVPYYIIQSKNEVSLFIPKGKTLDERSEAWLASFDGYIQNKTKGVQLSEEEQTVLAYLYKSEELNAQERYSVNLSPSNNHAGILRSLEQYDLIERVPTQNQEAVFYRIDPVLKRVNNYAELQSLFGNKFLGMSNDYKSVLDAIYQYNTYGISQKVNAKLLANYLFYRDNNNKLTFDPRKYDNFCRKIRNICNNLEKKGFIIRKAAARPDYVINEHLAPETELL
jgi:hypothetical protein